MPQFVGIRVPYATQKFAAYIAIGAIVGGFLLSSVAMFRFWLPAHPLVAAEHHAAKRMHAAGRQRPTRSGEHAEHAEHNNGHPPYYHRRLVHARRSSASCELTIGYYIDSLTRGHVLHGHAHRLVHPRLRLRLHARRAARRAPTTKSRSPTASTCTAAAGSTASSSTCRCSASACWAWCIAGNVAMVFVFWELVGICSYFLIGFYIERQSAQHGGQQGVHRQPRRRLRHDHRPDGDLVDAGHVLLRRHEGRRRQRRRPASSARSAPKRTTSSSRRPTA